MNEPIWLSLLKAIVECGPEVHYIDGCCNYCGAYLIDDKPHKERCEYMAAKAYLEAPAVRALCHGANRQAKA